MSVPTSSPRHPPAPDPPRQRPRATLEAPDLAPVDAAAVRVSDRRSRPAGVGGSAAAVPTRRSLAPPDGYHNITRARVTAFGGLIAAAATVAMIVSSTFASHPARELAVAARVPAIHGPRFWIVRPGQTLSSIAARESVSLTAVEQLNPNLVPNSLVSGQKVRLPD